MGKRTCDKLAKQFFIHDAVGVCDKASDAVFRFEGIIENILGRKKLL